MVNHLRNSLVFHPESTVSYFAQATYKKPRLVGLKQADRLSHVHVLGKTGVGKSTLLETLIWQDVICGRGCALIDPHGDLVTRLASSVPENRRRDLVYFNVPDRSLPYGYNPVQPVSAPWRSLVASGILETFKKRWADAWGVRMEHMLRNAVLTLLEQPAATLPDVLRLFTDPSYRRRAVARLDNTQVQAFWRTEYDKMNPRYRAESIAPIQNKVGAFLANPTLYRIFTKSENQIRLRSIMDTGGILLVNLAKGAIGEDSASLLGALLVTALGNAAYSRVDLPQTRRRPFFIYVDEFQSFTTLAVADMLSELRKFGVGMVLAHQYLYQLEPDVRHAVSGNTGTLVVFRLGVYDVPIVAKQIGWPFSERDLLNLPSYSLCVKLQIDGQPSIPFSADVLRVSDCR